MNALGSGEAQITLRGFRPGTKAAPVEVRFRLDGAEYELVIGDHYSAWRSHQQGPALKAFDRLFALLATRPDEWFQVALIPVDPSGHSTRR